MSNRVSYNGVPYEVITSYNVEGRQTISSERPILMMQIVSRSNKCVGYTQISNPGTLLDYFPDIDPHLSLEKARIIIDAGYNLYVNNVYTASGYASCRFINSVDNSEILYFPYDITKDGTSYVFEVDNYKNSVIKVNLSNVRPRDYFILEILNKTTKVQSNVLIYYHDKTKEEIQNFEDEYGNKGEYPFLKDYLGINIDNVYYAVGYGISLKENSVGYDTISLIKKNPLGFFVIQGNYSTEFYIVHNNGFINIGNHTPNISMQIDESFIYEILNSVKYDLKVLDVQSRYKTDNNEILLKIRRIDTYIYEVKVCKMYGSDILYYDTYLGATDKNTAWEKNLNMLDELINESSIVSCNRHKDTYLLPEGDISLVNIINKNDEYYKKIIKEEVDLFIEGLNSLNPDGDIKFNFYYDSNFNSFRYQTILYNMLKDYDVYGYFVYRGLPISNEPANLAYFTDQTLYVNEKKYNTLDISLVVISNNYLVSGEIEDAKNCTDSLFKEDYVNYINPDSVITRQQLRGYDSFGQLKDLRYCMIKSIFLKEIDTEWDLTVGSLLTSIQNTKRLFENVFGISIELELKSCKETKIKNDTYIEVSVDYSISGVTDISKINLNLLVS